MAILNNKVDESGQFDEEVLEPGARRELDLAEELRVLVEPVRVSLDLFCKIVGLIFRQSRLLILLGFEADPRRRYSLTRRLKQVVLELEGLK